MYKELEIQPFSHSEKSIAIVNIWEEKTRQTSSVIYHGGPFFDSVEKKCKIIAYYKLKSGQKLPAIIQKQYGKGQVIILGVHFEYNLENIENILSHMKSSLKLQKEIKLKENERQMFFNKIMQKIR